MSNRPSLLAEGGYCPQCDTVLTEVVGGWECIELSTGVGGCGFFRYRDADQR